MVINGDLYIAVRASNKNYTQIILRGAAPPPIPGAQNTRRGNSDQHTIWVPARDMGSQCGPKD